MKRILLYLFIALGLNACSLSNNDDVPADCGKYEDVSFTGVPLLCHYASKALQTNPIAIVIDSQEKLDANFTKHENSCPDAGDSTIDFSKQLLVSIYAGQKPTNGYEIKVASLIENKCEIVVNYYEKSPQSGEEITRTPTYPSTFLLVPKTAKLFVFTKVAENQDNIVIGTFANKCIGEDCRNFYQINDFSILKFQDVAAGNYNFDQYKYTSTTKKGDYTALVKTVPTEILKLTEETKTYGSPDASDQGGVYFQLRQGNKVTKVFIDNHDTKDQSEEIKAFKKEIQEKIKSLK